MTLNFSFDVIEDKVEFFEAYDLKTLEKKISAQIEVNKAILLTVSSVSHQVVMSDNGKPYFTAVVHFKMKKE